MKRVIHFRLSILRIALLTFLPLFSASLANAQSNRTVTFTGASSDFSAAEKFTSLGAGSATDYYVTFDASNIYIGAFRTTGTFGSSDNFTIYLDTDPNSTATNGTGVTTGQTYNGVSGSLPFSANYNVHAEQSYQEARSFGSSWASTISGVTYFTSTTVREVKIPFSSIGSPYALNLTMWMGYAGGIFANAPGDNITTSLSNPAVVSYFGTFGVRNGTQGGVNPINVVTAPATGYLNVTTASSTIAAGTYANIDVSATGVTLAGNVTLAPGGVVTIAATKDLTVSGGNKINNTATTNNTTSTQLLINGTMTVNGTVTNQVNPNTITIANGGSLTNSTTAIIATAMAMNCTNFNVNSGGSYTHSAVGTTSAGVTADFPGTARTFGATSNVTVTKWGDGLTAPDGNLPNNMGNVTLNIATLADSWNQSNAITAIQGNLTVQATGGTTREFRFAGATSSNLSIGGNIVISDGILALSNGAGVVTTSVAGGFSISGGTFKQDGSNIDPITFTTGSGDISITGGTTQFSTITVALGRTCNVIGTSNVVISTGGTFTVSGTTNIAAGALISGAGTFVATNANTATLGIASTAGITASGATGNVQTTTRTFNTGANYIYNSVANQATGTGLPTTVNTLTINNTGTSGSNIVTLTNPLSITATTNSLRLIAGKFDLNSKVLTVPSGGTVASTGGDFTTTAGPVTFAGTATVSGTLNFPTATLAGAVNFGSASNIVTSLQINSGGSVNTNAPTYGNASALIYNTTGTYGRGLEWGATGAGTIGTTVGYPNDVQVINNTTLNFPNGNNTARACARDLTIAAGSNLYADFSSGSVNLTVGRNVSIAGGLSLGSSSGGDLTVKGNFTRTGVFTPNGRAVFLNAASGDQTITGATIFDFLVVDKTAGNVVLANDVTCNQTLTLTTGKIQTSTNKVIISSTGSVSRTNGYVQGNLQKNVSTGATSRTFEIGDASDYTPLSISFANVTTAGDLTAKVTSGVHPNVGTSTLSATKFVNRYWTVTNSGTAFNNYAATFNYVSGDIQGSATTSALIVGKYDATTWTYPTVASTTSTSLVTNSTMTSFSDFVLAETGCIPPSITVQPSASNATYCQSATATALTVTAAGTGLIYQWYSSDDAATNTAGDDATVGTSVATYTPLTTSAGTKYYYCIVSGTCTPSVTSAISGAIVVNPLLTPSVSIAVTSGTNPTCSGTAVTFTATPTNGGTSPTYQWKKDGTNISGETAATYTDAGTTTGAITVVMTVGTGICSSAAMATSSATTLTVNPLLTPSVSIAVTSGTNPTCSGTAVTFTATPTNGGTSPTYQWKKGGIDRKSVV